MSDSNTARGALTDSPWFWMHLFCVAGLIAMFLMHPKYGSRQAQLERQFQGRQHATQLPADQLSTERFSQDGQTLISLGPLFWLLVVATVATWIGLWWTHFLPRRALEKANTGPEQTSS